MRIVFFAMAFAAAGVLISCQKSTTTSAETLPKTEQADSSQGNKSDRSVPTTAGSVVSAPATTKAQDGGKWGNIKGKIVVEGEVPKPKPIEAAKTVEGCGKFDVVDTSLLVADDGGLKNAMLFLYQGRTEKEIQTVPVHSSYEATAKDEVVFDNTGCSFEPRIVFMRKTQVMLAKNSDPIGHNVDIRSRINPKNLQIPAGKDAKIEMKGVERLPAEVACGSHTWMFGKLLVRDEPYVAISAADGSFEIKNMPEGEWKFQFWHERPGYMADLMDASGKPVMKNEGRTPMVTLKIEGGKTLDLGTLTIKADALKSK
jgi:hypothetical protein